MDNLIFSELHAAGVISDASLHKIKSTDHSQNVSVYWDLRTILYLGVLLFTTGAGILVYKNIDTIGHTFILLFIAAVCTTSFIYCIKKSPGFTLKKSPDVSAYFDYILLLACLTFTCLIAYLQFQYHVFGFKYGLALFIPMLVLFITAYYFDNIAILSLAITNLGAWAGIAVTPLQILKANDFNSSTIIFTSMALGILLILTGIITTKRKIKEHFEYTYLNFGANILFISCLAAMFEFTAYKLLFMLALLLIGLFFYKKSLSDKSFYFLLITTLYIYIGLSNLAIYVIFYLPSFDIGSIYLAFFYFISSAIALMFFLIKTNKKFKI